MKIERIIIEIEPEYDVTHSDYLAEIQMLSIGESLEIYIADFRSPVSDEGYRELLIGNSWKQYYSPAFIVTRTNEEEYKLE